MTRQLDKQREAVQVKRDLELVTAVEFELQGSVAHAGGDLTGFSVKFGELDTLVTMRARLPAGAMIAFVGAPTLADALRKAVVAAYHDDLRWRPDVWEKKEV